jgi:hypothetical protein
MYYYYNLNTMSRRLSWYLQAPDNLFLLDHASMPKIIDTSPPCYRGSHLSSRNGPGYPSPSVETFSRKALLLCFPRLTSYKANVFRLHCIFSAIKNSSEERVSASSPVRDRRASH